MIGLNFADGSSPTDTFELAQGDDVFLDVYAKDKTTKAARSISGYPEILFELEGVEFNITKTKSSGQITTPSDNVIRIPLDNADTQRLHGLYTVQVRLVSASGKREMILSGKGQFTRQVF